MRQVPAVCTALIRVVGDGRVARHFSRYLYPLDCPARTWSRSASATELASCATVLLFFATPRIVANLKSLEGNPFQAIYQAFARIHAGCS